MMNDVRRRIAAKLREKFGVITSWDEIETIPRYCPWCGAEVVDDEQT